MALVDITTNLKDLKYSSFNTKDPYVTKDINKQPDSRSSLNIEVGNRSDDIERITKVISDKPNFTLNQTFLRKQAISSKIRAANTPQERRRAVLSVVGNAGRTIASQIAQTGVAGTGVHFLLDLRSRNETYIGEFGGPLSLRGQEIIISDLRKDNEITTKRTSQTNTSLDTSDRTGNPDLTTFITKNEDGFGTPTIVMKKRSAIENRMYRGGRINDVNRVSFSTAELVFYREERQILPFEIAIYDPERISNDNASEYLYFTAYLNSYNDNTSGNWSGTSYIGRAEPLYNYTQFTRSIGFSFFIAAESEVELQPLYDKLNLLLGTTAPSYGSEARFMRGMFTKLTIGDLLFKVPGFFNNIALGWDVSSPWEIGIDSEGRKKDTPRVPHILNISCEFTPVHDFIPQYKQNFVANI